MINKGMGAALSVAVNKGFLEREVIRTHRITAGMMEIKAQNYSIEDKRYE